MNAKLAAGLGLVLAALPAAATAPLLQCIVPDQLDDAQRNLAHLLEDLRHAGDPLSLLADLAPDRSPHVARVTIPGDLVIAHPLVLANIDVRVCGDVWVLPTGSLTMYGATLTVDHPTRGGLLRVMGLGSPVDRLSPLVDGGALSLYPLARIHDDPVLGGLASRLLFTHPDRPSVVEGTRDEPGGAARVRVEPGASLVAEGAVVHRSMGIEAQGARVTLRDTTIESLGQGLYLFDTSGARVEGGLVRAAQEAFYLTSSQDAAFRGVRAEAGRGFHIARSEGVRVVGAALRVANDGLYAFDSEDVLLARAEVEGVSGFYAASSHRVAVEHSALRASGTAITLTDTRDARLEGNALQAAAGGGVRGVFQERTASVALHGNTARGFDSGFHLLTGEGTLLTCNEAAGNKRGVYVSTTVDVALRDNTIADNALLNLHAFIAPEVDARGNWWGSPAGPGGTVFEGALSSVAVEPWLTAPPECEAPRRDRDPPSVAIVRPERGVVYVGFEYHGGPGGSVIATPQVEGPAELGEIRIPYAHQLVHRHIVVVGPVTVQANATDAGSGVREVRFYIDGELAASDAEAPYEFRWDPAFPSIGWRTLRAEAEDHDGNVAQDEVLVLLDAGTRFPGIAG